MPFCLIHKYKNFIDCFLLDEGEDTGLIEGSTALNSNIVTLQDPPPNYSVKEDKLLVENFDIMIYLIKFIFWKSYFSFFLNK